MPPLMRAGRWRYRKVITLSDGSKRRITGTPDINTKQAAEEAEREHIAREVYGKPQQPRIGRPPVGDEARTINYTVRITPKDERRYERIRKSLGLDSIADAIRYAMDRVEGGL